MSSDTALDQYTDALREELRQELIAELKGWRDSLRVAEDDDDIEGMNQSYLDGVDDAILTIEQA